MKQSNIVHRCALCDEDLDPTGESRLAIDVALDRHHAVCPKRPIEVGDYVRLDVLGVQFVGAWQEGTVEEFDSLGYAAVRLQNAGPDMVSEIGNVRRLWVKSLRRIPRPEAQATVRTAFGDIKITADPTLKPGEFRIDQPRWMQHIQILGWIPSAQYRLKLIKGSATVLLPLTEGKHSIGDVTAHVRHRDRQVVVAVESSVQDWYWIVASEDGRVERAAPTSATAAPACAPGCQCGAHEVPKYRPVVVDKAAMERAMKDEKLMQRVQEEAEKRIQWLVTSGTKVHTLESPAPALVDGLDRDACLARWMENRLAVETRCAPPNVMTRMQRDVGRAMWLQRFGTARSAELRGMVDADREVERNRVTYCEVDPCD